MTSFKFQQLKPQKARGKFSPDLWADTNWVLEAKLDGDRRILQVCDDRTYLTGCRESVDGSGFVEKAANVPHITGVVDRISSVTQGHPRHLIGCVLDGEMVTDPNVAVEGSGSKYVTSIMGSRPSEAIRKQHERGRLQYAVFDCLFVNGRDVREEPLLQRKKHLQHVLARWKNPHVFAVSTVATAKERTYEAIVGSGGEGVVLKNIVHQYGNEKLWVKVKAQATADVVVLGFTAGRGKYAGLIGAIRYGQYTDGELCEYGQCSGMADDVRESLFSAAAQAKCIGRVLEIKHFGREPSGHFRHPQFLRFRSDKAARDCVYREDET